MKKIILSTMLGFAGMACMASISGAATSQPLTLIINNMHCGDYSISFTPNNPSVRLDLSMLGGEGFNGEVGVYDGNTFTYSPNCGAAQDGAQQVKVMLSPQFTPHAPIALRYTLQSPEGVSTTVNSSFGEQPLYSGGSHIMVLD